MLQIFKRNDISAYIALLFVAFLCKIKYILQPKLIVADSTFFQGTFFSMKGLSNFFAKSPSFYIFLSVCMLVIFSIFINSVVIRQKLYLQKNYFAALSFVLITSFFPFFNILSVAFISSVLLFIAFSQVLHLSNATQPRKMCFNIGILVSLAGFFYFPVVIFLLFFLLFIWLLRPFVMQEMVACLLGFLTPIYFALTVLYLNGNLAKSLANLNFHISLPVHLAKPVPFLIFAITSLGLFMYSLFIINKTAFKNPIIVRKKWRIIQVYVILSILISSLSLIFPATYFIIALPAFSILLSQSFHNRNEKMNIFTFFFLIIAVLCVQWIVLK